MDKLERNLRLKLKNDFKFFAKRILKIRTKSGGLKNFILNPVQEFVVSQIKEQRNRTGKVRVVLLKGRQMGCSTLVAGMYYQEVTHNYGLQAFIIAHEANATNNLYEIAQRYYDNSPDLVRPVISKSNAKELRFGELDSGYKLGTAVNEKVGRSSTIHLLHCSEVAFWENTDEHAAGVMQSVPDMPGTSIILESTANGASGYFYEMWQDAEAGIGDYIAIFVPWFWQEEYTKQINGDFVLTDEERELHQMYGLNIGQLNWRRNKIIELSKNGADGTIKFRQEYPNCASEAFILSGEDNFIPPNIILSARKNVVADRYGSIVLGVDPARFGQDRTCIIRRQGRVAYNLQTYTKIDTMQIVGKIVSILESEPIDIVCVDVGGLGAGVVDRLRELIEPKKIHAVNFGGSPYEELKYRNKRAEMWANMKQWLIDGNCQVVDSDELQSDLINVKYTIDSNSRLLLESKESMKKRGVRSSDAADALALTFALPKTYFAANLKTNAGLDLLANNSAMRRQLSEKANYRKN
jgi:hypothetical protein